jgi:hypothetical protein
METATAPVVTHTLGSSCLKCRRRARSKGVYCGFCHEKALQRLDKAQGRRAQGKLSEAYAEAPAWARELLLRSHKAGGV